MEELKKWRRARKMEAPKLERYPLNRKQRVAQTYAYFFDNLTLMTDYWEKQNPRCQKKGTPKCLFFYFFSGKYISCKKGNGIKYKANTHSNEHTSWK